jgi:hypothetical protein
MDRANELRNEQAITDYSVTEARGRRQPASLCGKPASSGPSLKNPAPKSVAPIAGGQRKRQCNRQSAAHRNPTAVKEPPADSPSQDAPNGETTREVCPKVAALHVVIALHGIIETIRRLRQPQRRDRRRVEIVEIVLPRVGCSSCPRAKWSDRRDWIAGKFMKTQTLEQWIPPMRRAWRQARCPQSRGGSRKLAYPVCGKDRLAQRRATQKKRNCRSHSKAVFSASVRRP